VSGGTLKQKAYQKKIREEKDADTESPKSEKGFSYRGHNEQDFRKGVEKKLIKVGRELNSGLEWLIPISSTAAQKSNGSSTGEIEFQ